MRRPLDPLPGAVMPSLRLTDKRFVYRDHAHTEIRETFKRFGGANVQLFSWRNPRKMSTKELQDDWYFSKAVANVLPIRRNMK